MEYKFKIKEGQEAAYEELKNINSHDGMGIAIIQYAEKWGSMMEEKITSGKTVVEAAESTWMEADEWGITGAMYGCSVSTLAEYWEYGDELREWHESKFSFDTKEDIASEKLEGQADEGISLKITFDDCFGEKKVLVPKVILYSVDDYMGNEMTIPGIELSEETEDGLEPYAIITKSFGEFIAIKDSAYIDLNNCPYATKLLELGYATETQYSKQSGFCEYPLWLFDEKFLKEIGGEQYEQYSQEYEKYMEEPYDFDTEESEEETIEQSM